MLQSSCCSRLFALVSYCIPHEWLLVFFPSPQIYSYLSNSCSVEKNYSLSLMCSSIARLPASVVSLFISVNRVQLSLSCLFVRVGLAINNIYYHHHRTSIPRPHPRPRLHLPLGRWFPLNAQMVPNRRRSVIYNRTAPAPSMSRKEPFMLSFRKFF